MSAASNRATPPTPVRTVREIQQMEHEATAALSITLYQLMQRAGTAAFRLAQHYYAPLPAGKRWLILSGNGNNGGDGYVVARLAKQAHIPVSLLAIDNGKPLPAPAQQARDAWLACGGEILPIGTPLPADSGLIIDGLTGIGLQSAPREPLASLIEQVNHHPAPVLALDIPSGLLADTGATPGAVIHAQHTLTFIALKPGLLTGQARNVTGTLHCDTLELDHWLARQPAAAIVRYDQQQLANWLLPRLPCVHKGHCGRLLIIGGEQGMAGAVALAGQAALRAGAGRVRVLTRVRHLAPLLALCPELMADELSGQTLEEYLPWADALVIGPGLGQQPWARQALQATVHFRKPMLWDADALNLLASQPAPQENRIITPHPAEAARLLNISVTAIENDRLQAAGQLLKRYGGGVLLKGAGSIIAHGQQRGILGVGNPGMATAGMGDVLSGIIGALLAQGLPLDQALCAGAVAHSAAADWQARRHGTRGLLASDVISALHRYLNPHHFTNPPADPHQQHPTDLDITP